MSYWRTYEDPDYYDDEDQEWPDEDEYRNYQQEEA